LPKKRISRHAKHLRQSRKRRLASMSIKSAVKTGVSRARAVIVSAPAEAGQAVRSASRALDKAATKGVIHKRAAARRKSRLARRLNRTLSAAPEQTSQS